MSGTTPTVMTITPDAKREIEDLVTKALQIAEEISDLRGSLNDKIKDTAGKIGVEPKVIKEAIRIAKKGAGVLQEKQDQLEQTEEVLRIAGRL